MVNVSELRVRYAETDQMGYVYYANYLVWMEIGRTNLLRDMGLEYKTLEAEGIMLPVVKAFAKYLSPAFYDEIIQIHSTITRFSGPRVRIDYRIVGPENKIVCLGFTEHAFISSETRKVIKAPEALARKIRLCDRCEEFITQP